MDIASSQTSSESCVNVSPRPAAATADTAKTILDQIFARSYGVYNWTQPMADNMPWQFAKNAGFCSNAPNVVCETDSSCAALKDQYGRKYDGVAAKCIKSTDAGWDVRNPDLQTLGAAPLDKNAHEPYIYPIKQSSCRPTDGKCQMDLASRNSITVNDKNDGVVTGAGTMKATVKFYFETDRNHMPGKRIVVDWGDRTDTTDLSINYGLYKNRVGLHTGSVGTCDATTLKCSNTGLACTVATAAVDCKDGEAGKLGCDADQTYCSNDSKKQCSKDGDCIPPTADLSCNSSATCNFDNSISCTAPHCTISLGVTTCPPPVADAACTAKFTATQLANTCSVNSGFGRSTRACENAYIAYSHTYTCDDTTYSLGLNAGATIGKCDNAGAAACRIDADCGANVKCVATGLPAADSVAQKCIFKPRVMVLDNWGWCNGVCKNDVSYVVSDICYSGMKQNMSTPIFDCDVVHADETEYPFPSINPWAKFNGTIEVRR
jgi:hypothetical protein